MLTPPQMRALEEWAEKAVPWIRREALGSFTTLEAHVEECLDWWRADGRKKLDWPATIRNRIRQVERRRLERMARLGDEGAALALRRPIDWAKRYDAKARQSAPLAASGGDGGLIRPGGGNVIAIAPKGRG